MDGETPCPSLVSNYLSLYDMVYLILQGETTNK